MPDQVTKSDVQTFAAKLEAFAQDLSPAEQAMLAEILTAAQAGKGEVQGFAYDAFLKIEGVKGEAQVQTQVSPNFALLVQDLWLWRKM